MREVDIVLERDDGMIVGIEVKASATVKSWRLRRACGHWPRRAGTDLPLASSSMTAPISCRSAIGWRPRHCHVCGGDRMGQ